MSETVLIVGASGNIGVSVIIAALRTNRQVIALVRNKAAEEKIVQHVGSKDGITFVKTDVTKDGNIQQVVNDVKTGKLPSFQHVYITIGAMNWTSPMYTVSVEAFHDMMALTLDTTFFAYKALMPYLLEHGGAKATCTLITGGAGEYGAAAATAVAQGGLFTLANVACRENRRTNVRFNEVYLCYRVDYDSVAEELGEATRMKASYFAKVYEKILTDESIKGNRISVLGKDDVVNLKMVKKVADHDMFDDL